MKGASPLADPASGWPAPPSPLTLDSSRVHLWLVGFRDPGRDPERAAAALDPQERSRADRYRFPRDRDRFVVFRGALRTLLGRYLRIPPGVVRFGHNLQGKPFVVSEGGAAPRLEFNLSHSNDLALVAVALGRRVGVDIEAIRPERASPAIADRFFSASEAAAVRGVPETDRAAAFFSCWTRKEAYVKARGEGLSIPLKSFTVSVGTGTTPALLRSELGEEEVSRWSLLDPGPPAGYAAALAVEGGDWELHRWRYSEGSLADF